MKIRQQVVSALQNKFLKNMLNSLLLLNSKNFHFVLIKGFDRRMYKTKHHGRKDFCQYCLQCFSNQTILESHLKNCLAINHVKSFLLSE